MGVLDKCCGKRSDRCPCPLPTVTGGALSPPSRLQLHFGLQVPLPAETAGERWAIREVRVICCSELPHAWPDVRCVCM